MFSKINLIVFIALVPLFFACSGGQGNRLESDILDVYFVNKEDEKLASELGRFWKENQLVGDKKQSIKLSEDQKSYYVHLIASGTNYSHSDMGFREMKLLLDLQRQLDTTVFRGTKGCQILICDNEFNPKFNVND